MISGATYVFGFLGSFALAWAGTGIVRRIAERRGWVDRPESDPQRKIHTRPIPLLGGIGIWFAVSIMLAVLGWGRGDLFGGYLMQKHVLALIFGGGALMIGGFFDDRRPQGAGAQLLWPLLASLMVIAAGVGIASFSNPFGRPIELDRFALTVLTFHDLPYRLLLFADAFTIIWLMGMMFTTKFLDGLDGLASGVTGIGAFVLFILSLRPPVEQPETALLALIVAGAFAGFLIFNRHPARIFLGQGGSLLCGFYLGVLSIISGGKVATALLILGIPILDVVWVVGRRLWEGRSIAAADQRHLHHRLLRLGWSQRKVVAFLWAWTAVFGGVGLLTRHQQKVWALGIVVLAMILLAVLLVRHHRRHAA